MTNPFIIEEKPTKIKSSRLLSYNHKESSEFFSFSKDKEPLKAGVNRQRVIIFFALTSLVILIFLSRLFYLQILNGDYWLGIAEGNRFRIEKQIPARGIIFDRHKKVLVSNKPNFILSFIPIDLAGNLAETARTLSYIERSFPKIEIGEVAKKIKESDKYSFEPMEIVDNIAYEKSMEIMTDIKNYPALRLTSSSKRDYIEADYGLAQSLGYLGKINEDEWQELKNQDYLLIDRLGKTGLEKQYERQLRGVVGKKTIEVDALGNVKKNVALIEAAKGSNLILTIDAEFNKYFNSRLCETANSYSGKAAGLAINPENGEILALVSCPFYDNNYFSDTKKYAEEIENLINDEKQPLFNRVIQGEYTPGSIFKLIVGAAGLEEGVINKNTTFVSIGGIRIGDWFYPDWKSGGHGTTDLIKAIAESVNTFFYYTGGGYREEFYGLGMQKIISYAKKFGLSKKIGIDLPGEKTGFLPSQEWKEQHAERPWYIGDTYHLSIGQGDLSLTPLQICALTSYFANYGQLQKPHLLKTFIDHRGTEQDFNQEIIKQKIVDESYVNLIRNGLRAAVTSGSARYLSNLPFTVAGKTGTAEVGGDLKPHAWFTGFAPFEKPEIVITVLIENGEEGSRVAVPVAKDVLRWWMENKK